MITSIEKRLEIIDEICETLKDKLGNSIQSATVYGSTLCEDFCGSSDYDLLLVLHRTEYEDMKTLKEIKNKFKSKGIVVDFNVHNINETPFFRKKLYRHNNRAIYFQKEIELYGKTVIGSKPFQTEVYSLKELREEVIKVINSILYQARKLLINRELSQEERIRMMKFCIYVTLYSLASKNIYPKTRKEALVNFKNYFTTDLDPLMFLEIKTFQTNSITDKQVEMAYTFISNVDKIVYSLYGG